MSFISFLKAVGKFAMTALSDVIKYAIPVETLAGLLFPPAKVPLETAVNVAQLIQAAVIQVEQKYAVAGVQNGTGPQKMAEVLTLTNDAVVALLKQAGVTSDTSYVTSIVNAVVALLNVQEGSTLLNTATPAPAA